MIQDAKVHYQCQGCSLVYDAIDNIPKISIDNTLKQRVCGICGCRDFTIFVAKVLTSGIIAGD